MQRVSSHRRICPRTVIALLAAVLWNMPMTVSAASPATVYFPSEDGTELVGYLFQPPGDSGTPHPAIIMLHGRSGPYSSNINARCSRIGRDVSSPCHAGTLSQRHKMWGEYWANHGYLALHVDSFGPRERAHGYGRNSHDLPERQAVNEMTVRPLDAEGALAYLASRNDVRKDQIMLQGWSNGGSTALNVMYRQAQGDSSVAPLRFRAALVFYPGCGARSILTRRYRSDTEVWIFLAESDEEVSPRNCLAVMPSDDPASLVKVIEYHGATHDFDDPGRARQSIVENRAAKEDVMQRASLLFDSLTIIAAPPAGKDN
ncbi:dienelactone hydrolase [Herbaspirillum sp. meg3]|uniref:dienelactone hydrolase family protein n=1 Tax=Herbaspirillum sp. meg3 TaxID=2025949 RepID=UPI000B984201|nr:dienelactone hydrolase family protein [Herbaspirillum sp. meg3]ASU41475.1 dienelactone hydrolase [Herbaspirillum sp. meg3]